VRAARRDLAQRVPLLRRDGDERGGVGHCLGRPVDCPSPCGVCLAVDSDRGDGGSVLLFQVEALKGNFGRDRRAR
jgi:hypothetical protein